MEKRTIDEMIAYFNQEVSKMDISQENKIKLLGIITAIGYENKKQDVVRCKDCKHSKDGVGGRLKCSCHNWWQKPDFYCADGERRDDGQIQQSN